MMKSLAIVAFSTVFALTFTFADAQSGLGKSRKEQGKQEQGKKEQGSGTSQSGGLGKSQGGGNSGGGLGKGQGGGNSGGGTGRSQGGGNSGGNSGGGLGRSQGGGNSGGYGQGGGGNGSLGRSQGGGSSSGYGRSQGTGDLGRIDRDQLNRTNSIGKGSEQGRTGSSGYGSNNNRGRGDGYFRIDSPQINLNKGSLPSQVFRTETIRVNSRWREGYYSYYDNWRDDYFYYPYYSFSPWGSTRSCTISPWYYYPTLPGYISSNRIYYYENTSCNWGIGSVYQWFRGNSYNNGWGSNRGNSELDDALYDIVNLFERNDRRALDRLIPRRGRINIYMDSVYCYSLDANDFYDLMLDNVQSTRTTRYSIDRVTTNRDSAQVSASHEFVDPWGRRQTVYHHYRLEEDRYGYTITDFLTSGRR